MSHSPPSDRSKYMSGGSSLKINHKDKDFTQAIINVKAKTQRS